MSEVGHLVADRYRLTQHIGSGAMGVVWQAHDERLHRTVALKQLLLAPGLSVADKTEARERAMREGRIAARLQHPNAVTVYDVVDDNGQPVLVMEYVPSKSLSAVLDEKGTIDPAEAARIGAQIATALTAAHAAGIVHRDIKPGNVLLAEDGTVKITDFGISRATGDVTVTATGMLAGTPAYLAPEVAKGENPGPPSDIFSLGSTLYAAVEGQPPFGHTDNTLALLHAVAACRTIPPKQAGPMTGLLSQMLRENPAERPTMAESTRALAALAAGQAPTVTGPNSGSMPRVEAPLSPPQGLDQRPGETTERNWVTRPQVAPNPLSNPQVAFAPTVMRPAGEQTVNLAAGAYPGTGPNPMQRPAYPQTGPTQIQHPGYPPSGPNPVQPGYPPTGPTPSSSGEGVPWKKWLITAGAIVAAALVGILVANSFTNTSNSSAPPTPSLVAQPTTTTIPPTTYTPTITPISPTTQPTTQTQATNASSDSPGFPAMAGLVQTYYGLLPHNTGAAWQYLSTSAQDANGGFGNYENSWRGVAATEISNIAPHGADSVYAQVTIVRNDGQSATNEISFNFVTENGQLRLDNATVVGGKSKHGGTGGDN